MLINSGRVTGVIDLGLSHGQLVTQSTSCCQLITGCAFSKSQLGHNEPVPT